MTGVHSYIGSFIYYYYVFIFVDYVQRDIMIRVYGCTLRSIWDRNRIHIASLCEMTVTQYGCIKECDASIADNALRFASGDIKGSRN
ncbi:hypothetical protein ANAPH2_01278 [Anaplasma phagocytophilum]|nr:hypothetical protein ANAPH2_01278 [Anaplasma phagocytophilum]